MECLLVFIVRGVFDGDGVVTLTDFAALLLLTLSLPLRIFCKSWWGRWVGDIFHSIILQYTARVSTTTSGKSVLGGFCHDY
jgi:hypothetical protein